MMFTLLEFHNLGEYLDILGRVFKREDRTFESTMTKFASLITNRNYANLTETFSALEVSFQQSYRPNRAIKERELCYCGKHNMFGFKSEVAILLNGLTFSRSSHFTNAFSNLEIIQCQQTFH